MEVHTAEEEKFHELIQHQTIIKVEHSLSHCGWKPRWAMDGNSVERQCDGQANQRDTKKSVTEDNHAIVGVILAIVT